MRYALLWKISLMAVFVTSFAFAAEVVVYSSRNEQLIKPIFEKFTSETGIKVIYRTDKAGALIQRIKAEGKRTRADMLLTVDAGNLWHAKQMGLLRPVDSDLLLASVPNALRDPDNYWFGLSIRARTLVFNTQKLKASDLSSYKDLALSKWKGKVLLRTSKKVYNQSLVAMLIAQEGEAEAERIVKGWVDNLASPSFANDTNLMNALAQGTGSVGIVNSYYFGRLLKKNPKLPLALFWPDQDGAGVHVNISGSGLTAHGKNQAEALTLLEWLVSESAQAEIAGANLEYPVNSKATLDPIVAAWGSFKQSSMNLSQAGALQAKAIMLMDRVRYK